MSEREIGEIFFDGNVALQVEIAGKLDSCSGCYYNDNDGCLRNRELAGHCTPQFRTDRQLIIFKEIQL